ncbi:MAG: Ig-like domain-containing protein [Patescibacteria group bacterium]|nr:Ig-like domain-containing protein [Patescibacteria group bacterium]MDD5490736.1 Ig-like domain-containing protein [Patescibacteria group bacterium]
MKKVLFLSIFLLATLAIPAGAFTGANFTNNNAPEATAYENDFDVLVLDVIIPDNNGSADTFKAITLRNLGTAAERLNITKLVIWQDKGLAGWQGLGVDGVLGEAVWDSLYSYWYLDNLTATVPAGGLRIFASVETASPLQHDTTVKMTVPMYEDKNSNGSFDSGDTGIFVASKNNGPTGSAVENYFYQNINKSLYDGAAPRTNLTNLTDGQTLTGGTFKITGQSRDRGNSGFAAPKIVIDSKEYGTTEDSFSSEGLLSWHYDANFSAGSHKIKTITTDNYFNSYESAEISLNITEVTVTPVVFSSENSSVSASLHSILANGSSAVKITVTAKNNSGEVMPGKEVTLSSTRAAEDIITIPTATTDAKGEAEFSVVSNLAGESIFTAKIAGVALKETLAVYFFAAPGGTLIKGQSSAAVYLLGLDNKRYVFPQEGVYKSYYGSSFASVKTVSDVELAGYPLGKNMTYAPGTLIKIPSVPKVYVVTSGGVLKWVKTEDAAIKHFGANWAKSVKDVSEAFFVDYKEAGALE